MKKIGVLILFLAWINTLYSQEDINKVVFDESSNQEIILGPCDKEGLISSPVTNWFMLEYDNYSIDEETLKSINTELLQEVEILIVMGTWCSDSQRELPRFIKIADYLTMNTGQLIIIGVDKNKKADKIPITRMNIDLVPTFIFYSEGNEIGRIVETPTESLEKDFLSILSNK